MGFSFGLLRGGYRLGEWCLEYIALGSGVGVVSCGIEVLCGCRARSLFLLNLVSGGVWYKLGNLAVSGKGNVREGKYYLFRLATLRKRPSCWDIL